MRRILSAHVLLRSSSQKAILAGPSIGIRKFIFGLEGIILNTSGPHVADGSNFDLQYVPGSGNGWSIGEYIGSAAYWTFNYKPGPSSINGLFDSDNYQSFGGATAYVGDRLCIGGSGRYEFGTVIYMQVTSVGATGVDADAWMWSGS
jgi:hypothetical protein